jgi:hypothetical protein
MPRIAKYGEEYLKHNAKGFLCHQPKVEVGKRSQKMGGNVKSKKVCVGGKAILFKKYVDFTALLDLALGIVLNLRNY